VALEIKMHRYIKTLTAFDSVVLTLLYSAAKFYLPECYLKRNVQRHYALMVMHNSLPTNSSTMMWQVGRKWCAGHKVLYASWVPKSRSPNLPR